MSTLHTETTCVQSLRQPVSILKNVPQGNSSVTVTLKRQPSRTDREGQSREGGIETDFSRRVHEHSCTEQHEYPSGCR